MSSVSASHYSNQQDVLIYIPHYHQTPLDEATQKILEALKRHNWKYDSIEVKCGGSHPGDKYRNISQVQGKDFTILFDSSGLVSEVHIPKRKLSVFSDKSGPNLIEYVGKDWECDRQDFYTFQCNAKLKEEPRTYLNYEGSFRKPGDIEWPHIGDRGIAPYVVARSDMDREYLPQGAEAAYYNTEKVFQDFVAYLNDQVLAKL